VDRIALSSLLALCASLAIPLETFAQSATSNPYRIQVVHVPSPYWGYTYNPYASTLRGIASVGHAQANIIRAQGEFLVNREQAALVREQVRVAKLETRKKELEHWEWEREFKAGALERERDRIRAVEVDRSRKFPPASEILAATALNALLNELKAQPALPGDSTPIEPEWLAHIHVASPAGGHLGLLKHDRIHWPLMLRTSEFKNERENVESLIEQARRDAANKGLTGEEILLLRQLLSSLQRRADTATRSGIAGASWSPSDSIRVYRFLSELKATLDLLEQPETAVYLQPPQGKTVAEVLAYMKRNGLSFAPATVGTERHYIAFHRALADEVNRLQAVRQRARDPEKP